MNGNAKSLVRAVGAEPARLSSNNTVEGLVAPTGVWVEIDSAVEGHFMEQIAPGAFTKTLNENRDRIRAIFHHGRDSSIGYKVLGPIEALEEGEGGLRYRISLLDTQYNAELRPGIEAGLYGTSFKGDSIKPAVNRRPAKSDHNPKGLMEVRHTEIRMNEFGLTPLPVYDGTAAVMRSIVDDEVAERLAARAIDRAEDDKPFGLSRSRYENVLTFVAGSVWAMEPAALAIILGIIGERAGGYEPTPEEIRERIGVVERAEADMAADSPVRLIDVNGPIIPRANMFSEMSGATSSEALQAEIRDAAASEDVKSILLRIDSPGGSAFGMPELAAEIRAARDVKPVVAVADAKAASAAYSIAAQASELYVTPSGMVGSIGVYSAHDDISSMQEKLGVKTTLVSAGTYKTEGNPFEPLTEEARAEIQSKVDAFYEMFVSDVAKGRGVPVKTVKEDFGQGRMVLARDAVAAGMADGIATFDQTLARLEKQAAKVTRTSEPEPPAATTRTVEPERPVATTRKPEPRVWGSDAAPYWRL